MASTHDRIRFCSVSRCFRTEARGEVWALRNFAFNCAEEQWHCLLGPSGCGKTTVLRLAAGLDRPTTGQVLINGGHITEPRKDIGFISQEGDLLPWRTVLDNVSLGLEIRGRPKTERRQRAMEAIRRVRLPPEAAHSYAHELSGGMRQRVALARALCAKPPLLLLDEPFAQLDELTRHELQEELLDLWLQDRQTILFVTHSIEEAVFLADRIVVMTSGAATADLSVALPHPRDRFSPEFIEMMRQVRQALSQSSDNH